MITHVSPVRKKRKSLLAKKVFGWSLVALIGFLGLFLVFYNVRLYQKRTELEGRAQELQAQIVQLSQREQELQQQVEVSATTEYQERVLREQGLYQKPGEEVVTILPADEPEQQEQQRKVWWNPFTWFQ